MALPLGPQATPTRRPLEPAKAKGCRKHKCSKWKGGKCRCGRD
jgi:hypothetical protein